MSLLTTALLMGLIGAPPQTGTTVVPFRIGEDAIIVDAAVNGKKVSLMFDTGFGGEVTLDDTINVGKATGKMGLKDFVGVFEADTVPIKTLKMGDKNITATDMVAVLQPGERMMTLGYNMHTDGIMGFGVIKNEVTEINFQKKQFIFHPKSFDISALKPDNKRTFLLKMLPLGHSSIELEVRAPSGKKMVLALDTGNAFYATTHREVLERTGLWETNKKPLYMKSSGVASGTVDSWSIKLDDMTIFGVPVKTSYWDIIDLPSSDASGDGTVGFGFLSNFNIVIDYERRRVWLENFTSKVANDEPGDIGMTVFEDRAAKRMRIYAVAPDSPAEKAGVKRGDFLLSLDGKDIPAVLGYREWRRLAEGPVGSKVKLDLSRNGQLVRVELLRARLTN